MIQKFKLQELWKKAKNKNRICLYGNCKEPAIKSHVLQKNGILREISTDNHLIELRPFVIHDPSEPSKNLFNKTGVNNVYTFKGFCSNHDSNIFKPIESQNELDFSNKKNQALFCYRGLCQELRKKELGKDYAEYILEGEFPKLHSRYKHAIKGLNYGIDCILFFKDLLEKSIESNDFSEFVFHTIEIPKIEICISASISVEDLKNPNSINLLTPKLPFVISFLNVIPFKNKSIVIGGYHKDYICHWTLKTLSKLGYSKKKKSVGKILSDLIVLRLEFWTMSIELYKSISESDLTKYRKTFSANAGNYSSKLNTKINLFRNWQ